ncbi:MAG: myo-inosose-2 dehydratase [Christensenellales bacterium]|jgi:inosose dehydratase
MLDRKKVKLAMAPISWTNDDLPELGGDNTFEQCISEIALAGYEGTEIGNKFPRDGEALKRALEMRRLIIVNQWFSTYFTSLDERETIDAFIKHRDFLYDQGARVIGCSEQGNSIQGKDVPILQNKPVYTDQEWKKVVKGMNRLGELAEEKGMKACLHHHMGTGVQTPREIDKFMEMTNDNVYLLYDSGHIVFSEGNVESAYELLKKYIKRVAHVHLKDIRENMYKEAVENKWSFLYAVKQGVFTVPGDGMIDFKPIFKVLAKSNYQGWMVVEAEQDPAKANPFEYALKSRDYIRKTGGI